MTSSRTSRPSGGKVFGIGLSRTGTKSLAAALNLLGIRTIWYPHDERTYRQLATGDYRLDVLNRYDGITDTPVVPFFAQFDRLFPGSRFVLTIRDKESWLESCARHWDHPRVGPCEDGAPPWQKFAFYIDSCVYGCHAFSRDRFDYVYDAHIERVHAYFDANGPEKLLVMDVTAGRGWETLCPFLGVAPVAGGFPRITDNRSSLLS